MKDRELEDTCADDSSLVSNNSPQVILSNNLTQFIKMDPMKQSSIEEQICQAASLNYLPRLRVVFTPKTNMFGHIFGLLGSE